MRNQRLIAILALAVSLIAFGGCSYSHRTNYTVVNDLNGLSQGMQVSFGLVSHCRGFAWLKDDQATYICIAAGPGRPQASFTIKSVKRDGSMLRIEAEEAQTGNQPTFVLRFPAADIDKVTVVVGNATYQELRPGTGTYNGQIDNHSIELTTPNGPVPFQLTDAVKPFFDPASLEFKNFQRDEPVRFCFYINANSQMILTYIESSK